MENRVDMIVIAKSEIKSQKKKIKIAWIVAAILAVIVIISFIIDYSGYKKGQKFGLTAFAIMKGKTATIDSYEEQCENAYTILNHFTSDLIIGGHKVVDGREARVAEQNLRDAFYNIMETEGFKRYTSNNIADWFRYTNFFDYFTGYFFSSLICIVFYASIVFAFVFMVIVIGESKKELVVYEDSVLCKINSKKSKQLVFEDINNVVYGKNSLKLVGPGIKFKISQLTNAEEIKSLILDKKATQKNIIASNGTTESSADELKKYKELLDSGVISQEEFDTKKKQILGM